MNGLEKWIDDDDAPHSKICANDAHGRGAMHNEMCRAFRTLAEGEISVSSCTRHNPMTRAEATRDLYRTARATWPGARPRKHCVSNGPIGTRPHERLGARGIDSSAPVGPRRFAR